MNTGVNSATILQTATGLKGKIETITQEALIRNIGRQELIKGIWAALISKHPVFALGTTGVNKTATIRQMVSRIDGAIFDERLIPGVRSASDLFVESTMINEKTLPDGSKETSLREKLGRAAKAHVFFGDEFFKEDEHSALNAMIDFALEGVVRHEGGLYKTPLMLFIAAGNETPDARGKLAAVWSRMTIRLVVRPLDRSQKKSLIASRTARYQENVTGQTTGKTTLLTLDDVKNLQKARPFVSIPESMMDTVLDIYDTLAQRSDIDFSNVLNDDRRFGRVFDAMQALALMGGRGTVGNSDLQALKWMLWDDESQIPVLNEVLIPYTRTPFSEAKELFDALLSPTGALVGAKSGDITKGVAAVSQLKTTLQQVAKLQQEAGNDSLMHSEIQSIYDQIVEEQNAVIKAITGRR